MSRARLLAVLALAFAPGCAAIIRGTHQDVTVDSAAPRAIVRADGAIVTPGVIELRRGRRHRITAELPGRVPVTTVIDRELSWGWLALDIGVSIVTFPFGLAAPIVDFATGAIYTLEPDRVELPPPPEPREEWRGRD
jgi:hypothetical protein